MNQEPSSSRPSSGRSSQFPGSSHGTHCVASPKSRASGRQPHASRRRRRKNDFDVVVKDRRWLAARGAGGQRRIPAQPAVRPAGRGMDGRSAPGSTRAGARSAAHQHALELCRTFLRPGVPGCTLSREATAEPLSPGLLLAPRTLSCARERHGTIELRSHVLHVCRPHPPVENLGLRLEETERCPEVSRF